MLGRWSFEELRSVPISRSVRQARRGGGVPARGPDSDVEFMEAMVRPPPPSPGIPSPHNVPLFLNLRKYTFFHRNDFTLFEIHILILFNSYFI